jgi:hypothetical protein
MKVEARIDQLNARLWEIRISVNTITVKLETVEGSAKKAKERAFELLTVLQGAAGAANITTTGTL